jgi:hypothetical protein
LPLVILWPQGTHGQKAWCVQIFPLIYQLAAELSNKWEPSKAIQLINLIYSLNPDGNTRADTLDRFLTKFDLPLSTTAPTLPSFKENNKEPSIPFIIGFFLGDGSLGITLDERTMRGN